MASFSVKGLAEYETMLSRLAEQSDAVAIRALQAAAKPVADRVRRNLENLQEDFQPRPDAPYRYLSELSEGGRQSYTGIPPHQKEDLLEALGITPVKVSEDGTYNVKIGFESTQSGNVKGYGSQPTETYPKGQPLLMIARSVESGTSIQPKQPFFRPAVEATKKQAVEEMNRVISEAAEKIMK